MKYCSDVDIKKFEIKTDVAKELKGTELVELLDDDIDVIIGRLGDFTANFFFNLTSSNEDKEKFMYKYLDTPQSVESGIILYRNAFSISSYEGKKDWLGLGKRSRKSPAAASHPSGAWRVRENQMAGYVLIDKKENAVLQASSIAHEMKNDRNAIFENYNNIVDALKEYGMWDKLNSVENTRKSYKNVPYLLKNSDVVGKKLITFMDTMLEEIEKKQFETRYQSVADILAISKKIWERDYAWLNIDVLMDEDIVYQISEDMLQVVFDNLILNSVQQNDNTQKLNVTIRAIERNGFLKIRYSDNGKDLDDKYKTNPRKILEVHETTRTNGHGLGMWIVNNTCIMSGGEIQKIEGENGFTIEFTIGGKL